jgi:hypothetical protein
MIKNSNKKKIFLMALSVNDLKKIIKDLREGMEVVFIIILQYLQIAFEVKDLFLLGTVSTRYQPLLRRDAYEADIRSKMVRLTEKLSSIESKQNAGNQLRPSQLKLLQTIPENLASFTSILEVDTILLSLVSVVWFPLVHRNRLLDYRCLQHPGRTGNMIDETLILILQDKLSGVVVLFIEVVQDYYIQELVQEEKDPFVKYIDPTWNQSHLDGSYSHKRARIVKRGCCHPINLVKVGIAGVTPEYLQFVISKALFSKNFRKGDTL